MLFHYRVRSRQLNTRFKKSKDSTTPPPTTAPKFLIIFKTLNFSLCWELNSLCKIIFSIVFGKFLVFSLSGKMNIQIPYFPCVMCLTVLFGDISTIHLIGALNGAQILVTVHFYFLSKLIYPDGVGLESLLCQQSGSNLLRGGGGREVTRLVMLEIYCLHNHEIVPVDLRIRNYKQ